MWKLTDTGGNDAPFNMLYKDFRGDIHILLRGEPPHKSNSTGRVTTDQGTFYPSVIGLKWRRHDLFLGSKMTFTDLEFHLNRPHGPHRAQVAFPNGYVASVIRGSQTFGGEDGLYEMAVMHEGRLDYSTPLTSDVLGGLSEEEVTKYLAQLADLPPKSRSFFMQQRK